MDKPKRWSVRGIDMSEHQYNTIHQAQEMHDKFCDTVYKAAELACKESQKNLDEVWRKICEEGYAK